MAFLLEVMSKYAAFIAAVYVVCYPFFGRDTGILRSYQHTGLSMSIALGIYVAKYFANTSFKRTDYLFALIVLLALMVTGKRTLFVLPVIEYFFLFFSMREKDKYKKTSRIFILCLLVLPVLLLVIPSARNAVLRIIEGFGDKTLSHRTYIWAYAEMMWASKPIFGWGFGTMPYHISHAGVDLMAYGAITETGAHNIYLQMLAEIGIVGCVAFCVFFAGYLIYSVRQVRRMKESWSNQEKMVAYLSLIWQVWFLGYGFTGNPLYMVDECWVYFMALTLMNSVCSRQQKALRIRLK